MSKKTREEIEGKNDLDTKGKEMNERNVEEKKERECWIKEIRSGEM